MSNKEALSVAVYYHRRILEESCALDGLSTKGAFVHMAQPMPVGSPLVIRFRAEETGVGPALPCTVSHVEEISSREKTGRSGVAISFSELEEDRLGFLAAIVEGTTPQEAGADFPEEPDFTLPEPPIPGEAIAPLPHESVSETESGPETGMEPAPESPQDRTEDMPEPDAATEAAAQTPEATRASTGDVATGEIGADRGPEDRETDSDPQIDQPSVVVDAAVPEQLELRNSAAVSGEIGTQEPAPAPEEQPSVVVGELLTEPAKEEKEQAADQQAAEAPRQEEPVAEEEADKPKKKKRRRGRRKKKSK